MFGWTIWSDWKLSHLFDFENDVQNHDFIQQTFNDFGIKWYNFHPIWRSFHDTKCFWVSTGTLISYIFIYLRLIWIESVYRINLIKITRISVRKWFFLTAVEEMKRSVHDLSLPGFQIGSHIGDWNLDAPELYPIYKVYLIIIVQYYQYIFVFNEFYN